ncbi:hypothetical protein [Guyparkeria sp. SB14A]|uniref:hypothetical protein n=1 Tax=Guyparkeria sp. SB14A TaxID=2571147 RepID=UPI00145F84F2|nr:hypothetical protein [Guyparkeria sp. SB14A]
MPENKSQKGSDPFSELLARQAKAVEVKPKIGFIEEGLLPIVTALNHMLWHTGHEQPGLSGHDDVLVVA